MNHLLGDITFISLWEMVASPRLSPFLNMIAIGSAGLTFKSFLEGRASIRRLEAVEKSMSTRRIGESPSYSDAIPELIAKARVSVEITAIFPVVAIFLAPQSWIRIANELSQLQSRGVRVDVLHGSRRQREEALKLQFLEAEVNWNEWAGAHEKALRDFARKHHYGRTYFDSSTEFITFLLDVQDTTISATFWNGPVNRTDAFVPVISWVVDGEEPEAEAFFAINQARGQSTGFLTRDQQLIASFQSVRKRYPQMEKEQAVS